MEGGKKRQIQRQDKKQFVHRRETKERQKEKTMKEERNRERERERERDRSHKQRVEGYSSRSNKTKNINSKIKKITICKWTKEKESK